MKIKYLYLDDEDIADTESIPKLLESENKELQIVIKNPLSFANQIKKFRGNSIDGLILDLRLDLITNNGEKAEYRAMTLAQEIRVRATEGTLPDFPIVLCSTDSRLKKFYNKNLTGQDLFDIKYLKDEDMLNESKRVSNELVSLGKGYKLISKFRSQTRSSSLSNFFSLRENDLKLIDERLLTHSFGTNAQLPTHEYANFILKEIILKQSVLIDENVLLARLGVSSESKGIGSLLGILSKFSYSGPFHEAWPRWWWPLINNWWYSLFKNMKGIALLTAKERVETINRKLKLQLKPAVPIQKQYGSKFWTVCQFYNKPLDPFDGLILDLGYEPLPWQDASYLSLKAALDPKSKLRAFNISSTDKIRFQEYKKLDK